MNDTPQEANPVEPEASASAGPRVRGRKRRHVLRWSRWASILGIAAFATAVITLFTVDIGEISLPGGSLRELAERRATAFLERPMHIGRLSAYVSPGSFVLDDVVIEGPTAADRPFFAAKRITVKVAWWTLFARELHLEVNLYGWTMDVERFEDGQAHLPRLTSRNPSGKPFPLKIRGLAVFAHDGEFTYNDRPSPWSVICRNLNFSLARYAGGSTYVGMAEFSKGTVQIQDFEPMQADFRTRFQLDGGIVRLKHIDLLTDGATTHLDGYVDFGNWPEQEYRIQSEVDFPRMRELFWSKATWRVGGTGQFDGIFKMSKTEPSRDLSGQFWSDDAVLRLDGTDWQFPDLHGALQWTPEHFVVSHADADFMGGRVDLAYGLEKLGERGGANASFSVGYRDADVFRFTRQVGWTALEPEGRATGDLAMTWRNGHFGDTVDGHGTAIVVPPDGRAVAAATLPALAEPIPFEAEFEKYRPLGPIALAAGAAFHFGPDGLDFEPSWAATPKTFVRFEGRARGTPVNLPFHVTSHDWQASDRLFAAIMSHFGRPMGAIEVGGRGTFDGTLTRSFNDPRIEGRFAGDNMAAWKVVWGRATGEISVENSYLTITNGRVDHESGGRVFTDGRYALGYPRSDGGEEINARIRAEDMPLPPLRTAFGLQDWPIEGRVALADLHLTGDYEKPKGEGELRLERGTAWQEPFDEATGRLTFRGDGSLDISRVEMTKGEGTITGFATLSWAENSYSFDARGEGISVGELARLKSERAPLSGNMRFEASGSGSFDLPSWRFDARVPDMYAGGEGVGAVRTRLRLGDNVLTVEGVEAESDRLHVDCQGNILVNDDSDATLNCRFANTSIDPYLKFVARDFPYTRAIATGSIALTGPLADRTKLDVETRLTQATLTLVGYPLENDGPVLLAFRNNAFLIGTCLLDQAAPDCEHVRFTGDQTKLELAGVADLTTRRANVRATGDANLAVLQAFYPSLDAKGGATLQATLTGSFDDLALTGRADVHDGSLRHFDLPHGFTEMNGPITMEAGRIAVDGLRAVVGEGLVTFTGGINLDGYRPAEYDLHADGASLHLRIPSGLQSTVHATLNLLGPVSSPVLSGTVDVLRASYALRVDPNTGWFAFLTGAVDTSGAPLPAPAPEPAPTFPLGLDIRIRARALPFVETSNALISGGGEVDIGGTIDSPVVTGRLELDHGEWVFSGNRYKLRNASIDFTNPFRFDPFFDLTAETRVPASGQTYVVTLRFNGTLNKLQPTITSDPWLPEWQVVSLLLGERPDVGTAELRAQGSPQELQQQALRTAAFAIITSPISTTVGSAVQRITTIDTVQIVPLLGNENNLQQLNPTARIVLGKRISDRIYLTYSRTLSGAQNEIILVEFDQNDQVSWVLSRNEDRTFALDFRLRYVFR